MHVNGADISLVSLGGACTLKAFLEQEGYTVDRVAVEKNGEIVPKNLYENEPLTENDRLEIVSFVGGG